MASGTNRLRGPTCKARTKAGKPCEALAGSDGLCTAHRDPDRMRELGRKGGKGRRGGPAKQLPPEQREGLRGELRKLDPSLVRTAIEQALAGGNESARVSAVKMLADLELYQRDKGDGCWRCAQAGVEVARLTASCKLLYGVLEAEFKIMAREKAEWQYALEQLEELAASMMNGNDPIVVVNDVSAERAAEIFEHLEEVGLIRRGSKAFTDEKAALRQEREALDRERAELKAMRQELSPA